MNTSMPPALSKFMSTVAQLVWPTVSQEKPEQTAAAAPTQPADPIAPSGVRESVLKQLGPNKGRNFFLNA
jgi:hypothetical protein